MNRNLQEAIDEWDREVSNEAARLIRRGVPPFQAQAEALETIKANRNRAHVSEVERQFQELQRKD